MKQKKLLAGAGVILTIALALGATALAAGARPSAPSVTVRVEGPHRTLLAPSVVATHAGSLTRFGAPRGKCPDKSAAGSLDGATHHRWKGTWESSFDDYEVTSILGEAHPFSSKDYWEIFVNNVAAQTGACEIKVKPGQQILLAAVPSKGAIEVPLMIGTPTSSRVGDPLRVHVRALKGHALVDVQGAQLSGRGVHATTNNRGLATVTPSQRGRLVLHASKAGYVRGFAAVNVS